MIYIAIFWHSNERTENVKKLQMFGCSHWLIIKMLSLTALKWRANGNSLEDEASPEISQMCSVLARPLGLPEHPFTAKTIAYILKWNSESFSVLIIQTAPHILFELPFNKAEIMYLIFPKNYMIESFRDR